MNPGELILGIAFAFVCFVVAIILARPVVEAWDDWRARHAGRPVVYDSNVPVTRCASCGTDGASIFYADGHTEPCYLCRDCCDEALARWAARKSA